MASKIIDKDKLYQLEVGQRFKSVNKLIEYLGIINNHHKGEKEKIITYMKDYITYESTNNPKRKNEIEITSINYDLLIEPILDSRMDNLTAEKMGYMIASNIKAFGRDKNEIFISKGRLYLNCQMCNDKWNEYKFDLKKINELAEEYGLTEDFVNEYFDLTNRVFNSNVNKGIKYLKSRKLILTTDGYGIKQYGRHRKATKEEALAILEFEYQALTFWGLTYKDLWKKKKYKKFRSTVCDLIQKAIERGDKDVPETLADMDYYYEAIIFMYNYNTITDAMKKMETVTKREASKVSNGNVKKAIDNKTEDMTQREAKKYKSGMNKLIKETIKNKPSKEE